jgi:hypothetical protein
VRVEAWFAIAAAFFEGGCLANDPNLTPRDEQANPVLMKKNREVDYPSGLLGDSQSPGKFGFEDLSQCRSRDARM